MEKIQELQSKLTRVQGERDLFFRAIEINDSSKYVVLVDNRYDEQDLAQILPDNVLVIGRDIARINRQPFLDMIEGYEREKIEQWLLKGVLKAIVPGDILTIAGDSVMIGGRKLNQQEVNQLRNEIKVIQRMRITKILNETIAENARQVMFRNAKSIEDIKFGKIVFYLQDLTEKIYTAITRETLDEKMKNIVHLKQKNF